MALRPIGLPDKTGDDLPWVNDYLDGNGEPGDTFPCIKVKLGSKGFIIETTHFKGFLYKDSAIFNYLLEALEAWVGNGGYNYPLFVTAEKSGKVSLAIDDEGEHTVWMFEKSKKLWTQKIKKEQDSGSEVKASNPLLPTPPPATVSRGKGNK